MTSSQIGLNGLRSELIRMQGMIIEGLKEKQAKVDKLYKREDRKVSLSLFAASYIYTYIHTYIQ